VEDHAGAQADDLNCSRIWPAAALEPQPAWRAAHEHARSRRRTLPGTSSSIAPGVVGAL
jgi:hypothetical protein